MCKKLIYLISFVLALGLIGNASADLVVHWKLDERSGTTAVDSTGNGYDGTFVGRPERVEGYYGGGLHFTAEGQILLYSMPAAEPWPVGTVTMWLKADTVGQDNWSGLFSSHLPNSAGFQIDVDGANPGSYNFRPGNTKFGPVTTDWVHLTLAWDGTSANFYYNGILATSRTVTETNTTFNRFALGTNRNGINSLMAVFDDVRVYNRALTQNEIQFVMQGKEWPYASRPKPADGALLSDTWVNLSWTTGGHAVSHDVYFGDNLDDVNDGTVDTFQGNQAVTQFRVGSPQSPYLVADTTYYWRIDEVNDTELNSPWKGDVWSFMTPPKTAYDPYPADGADFFIDPNVILSWTAGFGVKLHHVYFGDNFDDVNDADTSDTTGIYRSVQAATTYTPGPLELEKTYYWRVDEVEATRRVDTIHKGDVWSFTTTPEIAITDLNLLCWWKFDETEGTTAVDYSGHYHYGIVNGATWVANGRVGGALDFGGDGDHMIDEDAENYLNGLDALTVCMWIKSDLTNTDKGFIVCEEPDASDHIITMRYDASGVIGGGTNLLKMAVVAPNNEQQLESSSNLQTTEWQHVCMTWSTGQQLKFYVNGVEDTPQANRGPRYVTTSGVTTLIIGKGGKDEGPSAGWDGMIDDVRIYNIALSDAEIYALGVPSVASAPSPADGATDVTQTPTLRWTAGDRALQHDVYFGTDEEAVRNANMRSPEYKDTKDLGSESYDPGKLDWNTTYYWRVDEYNTDATISEGRVWSFTVVVFVDPLAEALDTDLSFTTGGSANWFGQTTTSYHDGDASQSGDISDGEDSWIQTTVSGTGTVKFYWKVSSEDDFDFLEFYIDGSLQDRISGSVDWQQNTYTISTSGLHVLEWRYVKDDSNDYGSDCGWVDKMEWVGKILGHDRLETTEVYLNICPEDALGEFFQKVAGN